MTRTLDTTCIEDLYLFSADESAVSVNCEGNYFKNLCRISNSSENWFRSTDAFEIPGVGCLIQNNWYDDRDVCQSSVFVPGVRIVTDGEHNYIRKITLLDRICDFMRKL